MPQQVAADGHQLTELARDTLRQGQPVAAEVVAGIRHQVSIGARRFPPAQDSTVEPVLPALQPADQADFVAEHLLIGARQVLIQLIALL